MFLCVRAHMPQCACQWRERWRSPAFDLLLAAGQVSRVAASLYSGTAELSLQILTQSNMLRHTCVLSFFFPPAHSACLPTPRKDTHRHTGTRPHTHTNELIIPFSYSFSLIHHWTCFASQGQLHGDGCSRSLNISQILCSKLIMEGQNPLKNVDTVFIGSASVLSFLPLGL